MVKEYDVFKNGISELKKQIEDNINKIEQYSNKITDEVATHAKEQIQYHASSIGSMSAYEDEQGSSELSRTMSAVANNNEIERLSPKHSKIYNTTQEATYAEFGTGMIGEGTPHPLNDLGWEYDVNQHGEKGWRYIGQGGKLVHTKGYPSFSTYYYAYEDTKDDLGSIGRKLFTEVFDDEQ